MHRVATKKLAETTEFQTLCTAGMNVALLSGMKSLVTLAFVVATSFLAREADAQSQHPGAIELRPAAPAQAPSSVPQGQADASNERIFEDELEIQRSEDSGALLEMRQEECPQNRDCTSDFMPYRTAPTIRLGLGFGPGSAGFAVDLGFRFRLVPQFGFHVLVGGLSHRQARGRQIAFPFTFGVQFFTGHESKVFFAIGEFSYAPGAFVPASGEESYASRSVFGTLGAGFEWRVAERAAVSVAVLGIVKHTLDDVYEFFDFETGRGTNTSVGVLLRLGFHYHTSPV